MFSFPLNSSAQISKNKNKPTNPSPYLHADVHLQPTQQHHPLEKPPDPEITVVTATTIVPEDSVTRPASKKRLLIRVEVEAGRVVSESSCYTD